MVVNFDWNTAWIRDLVRQSLSEDRAWDDRTTRLLIPSSFRAKAVIRAKQNGVICGLPFAQKVFKKFDRALTVQPLVPDGKGVKEGEAVLRISGRAGSILSAERPALNALQHLSGIATWTALHVKTLGKSRAKIFDTRKTIPGWRGLAKYAVRCGGGMNHRSTLAEAILVKENHEQLATRAGVSWMEKVKAHQRKHPAEPIELEVQTLKDFEKALAVRPRQVLLDNMSLPMLKRLVTTLRRAHPRVEIEVSGGITLKNLPKLRALAIDRISVGALTHSAPAFDCSLDWDLEAR